MSFLKFFFRNWIILSVVLFLFESSVVLILLLNASHAHPKNIDFLYLGDEINISLVLFLSFVFSVLVGMLFAVYDFFLPRSRITGEKFR